MENPPVNVFLIETSLQLLNAIEAKNDFKLVNNHLIVRLGEGPQETLKSLVLEHDWDGVHYFIFSNKTMTFESALLGQRISKRIRGYCYDYQQYLNRKMLDGIAISLGRAENIFLGNYIGNRKIYDVIYMRHFANTLKHEKLYIMDDGTDIMQVNEERKNVRLRDESPKGSDSFFLRLKEMYRKYCIDWNDKGADRVTFFSAYDMNVGSNDFLIRNEYKYLRKIAAEVNPSDEVFFLGQWLIEDRYIREEYYLDYLRKVKEYFTGEKLVYIPHPRESSNMINKIKESLGLEIKQFNVPIEYEISIKGNIPKVLASFFSSALQNCHIILGQKVNIKSFYIAPEHLMRAPEFVQNVYEYYKNIADENFEVIKL